MSLGMVMGLMGAAVCVTLLCVAGVTGTVKQKQAGRDAAKASDDVREVLKNEREAEERTRDVRRGGVTAALDVLSGDPEKD